MRISDWSSDVCSSDLALRRADGDADVVVVLVYDFVAVDFAVDRRQLLERADAGLDEKGQEAETGAMLLRSEEHTSELKSLMRISYAVFCLKKKITNRSIITR